MFNLNNTTRRRVWDICAEIAAAGISRSGRILGPIEAAEWAAKFADEMCRQRAARIPTEETKKK